MAHVDAFDFGCDVPISYGHRRAGDVAADLAAHGRSNPFVVTDPNIEESSILDPIVASLEEAGLSYDLYAEVEPNPSDVDVERAATVARESGCDSVVAVGGGSSIDTGKAAALLATNGGSIHDYWRLDYGVSVELAEPPLPVFAVPTTVGTGSEVTAGFVVTDTEAREKKVGGGAGFTPTKAILDPTLLETLPPRVTASTGMDSLTQALESYVSAGASPFSEALALRATELVAENLRPAVSGTDLEALASMQLATTMGGVALSNSGLGLVHAMSHPVSAYCHTPHGLTNGVLLPYVLEYNLISAPGKFADLARAMGRPVHGRSDREAADECVAAVRQLKADVGIPENLRALDVDEDLLPTLAEETMNLGDTNPREFTVEEILDLFERAY